MTGDPCSSHRGEFPVGGEAIVIDGPIVRMTRDDDRDLHLAGQVIISFPGSLKTLRVTGKIIFRSELGNTMAIAANVPPATINPP